MAPTIERQVDLPNATESSRLGSVVRSSWNGHHWLVVWTESPYGPTATYATFGMRVNADGTAADSVPLDIRSGGAAANVLWTGTLWLVVWSATDSTVGVRIASDGTLMDSEPIALRQPEPGSSGAWIGTGGDELILMWHRDGTMGPEIVGAVLDRDGLETGEPLFVVSPGPDWRSSNWTQVQLTWAGARWLLSWATFPSGQRVGVIHGAWIAIDGTVTELTDPISGPRPAWDESPSGAAWRSTGTLVVWSRQYDAEGDPGGENGYGVFGAIVDDQGTSSAPFRITSSNRPRVGGARVGATPFGWLVTWGGEYDYEDVYGRFVLADGQRVGEEEFRIKIDSGARPQLSEGEPNRWLVSHGSGVDAEYEDPHRVGLSLLAVPPDLCVGHEIGTSPPGSPCEPSDEPPAVGDMSDSGAPDGHPNVDAGRMWDAGQPSVDASMWDSSDADPPSIVDPEAMADGGVASETGSSRASDCSCRIAGRQSDDANRVPLAVLAACAVVAIRLRRRRAAAGHGLRNAVDEHLRSRAQTDTTSVSQSRR